MRIVTKMLPRIILFISFLLTINPVRAQDEFELVESVPMETILEQSSISRTKDVWLKMINNAKESIDIETFYFANEKDEPLEEIMTAIKNSAERGVQIRIIIDSAFYSSSKDKSIDELEGIQNITIKKIPMGRIAGGIMHAKYFIVDYENLFVGSQNMDWRALIHIHEIGARVRNKKIAETFLEVFNYDWDLSDGKTPVADSFSPVNSENPVEINSDVYGKIILYPAFSSPKINFPGLSFEEDELLKTISNAKDSLLIQMYSYSPKAKNEQNYYDAIDKALRNAASKGVKIKIIFSDWAIKDIATDFIKDLSIVNNIEIKFSSIPQFSGGFIPFSRVEHCKYFLADNDISWISTSNWEWSYFYNCRNATLIVKNEKINFELSREFFRDWYGPNTAFVDIDKKYESVKKN